MVSYCCIIKHPQTQWRTAVQSYYHADRPQVNWGLSASECLRMSVNLGEWLGLMCLYSKTSRFPGKKVGNGKQDTQNTTWLIIWDVIGHTITLPFKAFEKVKIVSYFYEFTHLRIFKNIYLVLICHMPDMVLNPRDSKLSKIDMFFSIGKLTLWWV